MFQKIKNWFRQERMMQSVNNLQILHEGNDPRELQRPERFVANKLTATTIIKENNEDNKTNDCYCKNCREILDNFSECIICMEPLQCTAICSCIFCGNYTCWNCSEKVNHCPFCRATFQSNENRIRNFALERILLKLELPCRHARWGCRQQLHHKERLYHETSCSYAPIGCPFAKSCGWYGETTDVIRHLKDSHDMTLIASNGISIEIADFRKKLLNTITIPRLYTVSLNCHGNIYICKLKMINQKLGIRFCQISGEAAEKNKIFAATLEILTGSRIMKGSVKISPKYKNNKEILIPGKELIYSTMEDDLVNINIAINPLN